MGVLDGVEENGQVLKSIWVSHFWASHCNQWDGDGIFPHYFGEDLYKLYMREFVLTTMSHDDTNVNVMPLVTYLALIAE